MESFFFGQEKILRQIIIEGDDVGTYQIRVGKYDSPDESKDVYTFTGLYTFTGPGIVTIPFPFGGYPIQQWSSMWFAGGTGRMTAWFDKKDFIAVIRHPKE